MASQLSFQNLNQKKRKRKIKQTLEMAQGAAGKHSTASPDLLIIDNACDGHVMAGGVPVIAPDLKVKRGMIQALGGVLLP